MPGCAWTQAYIKALVHTRSDSGGIIYRKYKNTKKVTLVKGPQGFGFGILGPDAPTAPRTGLYCTQPIGGCCILLYCCSQSADAILL